MEFLDEDARPRFLFQSKPVTSSSSESNEPQNLSKPLIAATVIVSLLLLALSFFFLQSEPYQSLLIWVAVSVLVGPFAPPSVTGGDIRVGRGAIVEFPEAIGEVEDKRASQKRQKPRRGEDSGGSSAGNGDGYVREERKVEALGGGGNGVRVLEEEGEWGEEDVEVLKKQMVKNPVGKPRRWEVIAEGLGGRYKVESVIKKAKELGEKRVSDSDSYAEFLRKRKFNEKKVESGSEEMGEEGHADGGVSWGASEDIALLNALKAFPKEASMRWEKIAAAVPGKTKAACVKRVAELKKGFRSAKAAAEE
ncbi:transcription factor MAMYB [Argentina anserina]|uniref:transcription factor MAMYB n=1 Tax=Argentina anserina TaxID=57926 RepID=UPI0021765B81|nr:transcription factor MAMYB [Potentilla anserina]